MVTRIAVSTVIYFVRAKSSVLCFCYFRNIREERVTLILR